VEPALIRYFPLILLLAVAVVVLMPVALAQVQTVVLAVGAQPISGLPVVLETPHLRHQAKAIMAALPIQVPPLTAVAAVVEHLLLALMAQRLLAVVVVLAQPPQLLVLA
jgi:hypothetical protein